MEIKEPLRCKDCGRLLMHRETDQRCLECFEWFQQEKQYELRREMVRISQSL